jgi:hypothetical protein
MQARKMTGHDAEEGRHDRTATHERRMLAVGKRIDHRWIVEMSLGRTQRALSGGAGGRAGHTI